MHKFGCASTIKASFMVFGLHKLCIMKKILKVHNVNDYARYIGAPVLHPLVSVIHYDELKHCRHSLNNYDVYGLFIADETLEELTTASQLMTCTAMP